MNISHFILHSRNFFKKGNFDFGNLLSPIFNKNYVNLTDENYSTTLYTYLLYIKDFTKYLPSESKFHVFNKNFVKSTFRNKLIDYDFSKLI